MTELSNRRFHLYVNVIGSYVGGLFWCALGIDLHALDIVSKKELEKQSPKLP